MTSHPDTKSIIDELNKRKVLSAFACIFFTIGFWTLFSNEGKALRTAHVLDEALRTVLVLNPYDSLNSNYDGRLIYICARIKIDEPLTEPEYGISVQAVKLKRRVQMFQWIEESTSTKYYSADGTEQVNHYYYTDWKDKLVDSTTFYMRAGHENPKEIPIKSQTQIADVVEIGALTLSLQAKSKFVEYFEITSDERPDRHDIKLHMGLYYHTDDIWNPEVGDIRIQFSYAGPSGQEVTVIGQQNGDKIVPYYTQHGVEILMVRPLTHTLEQMFHLEHSDLRYETWKIRGVGWFLLLISANCVSDIVQIFVSRIPILKNVRALDSQIYTNLFVTVAGALMIIAFTWIAHKPIFALGLMIMAVVPFFYCGTVNVNNIQYVRGRYNRL